MKQLTPSRALFAGLMLAAGLTHAADYSAWQGSRDIILNTTASGANVANNVANFPVLIRLTEDEASIITASKAGGADIRFSKPDGTPLPYEIENWEPWGASIWVLVDTVYGNNSTQKIVMHYDNPDATSESNGYAVFDTANGYVGAWHFGNGAGSLRPSSVAGAPNAFVHNSDNATSVKGLIGRADTLRHIIEGAESADPLAGNWIELNRDANGAPLATPYAGYTAFPEGFSYSLWIRPDGTPNYWRMLVLAPEGAEVQGGDRILFMGGVADPTRTGLRWTNGCGWVEDQSANPCNFNNTITNGVWNHFFFTKTPGNSPVQMYVNGELKGTSSSLNDVTEVERAVAWIGRAGDNNPYFTGVVDNATLANAARSADFVKLSYENQKEANTLVNIGLGGPVTSTPFGAWSGHRTITLNTTATGAKVTGDVHDFPVLVRLTSAEALILSEAKSDGSDIRFTKTDDVTPLPYHIESWDSAGAAIWVKVDTIKGSNATQAIRMHWGNPAAENAGNSAAVFDTTNGFIAVWHMNGASGEVNAAGDAGLNAAATGTVPSQAGLIGKARAFSSSENFLSVPGSASGKLNLAANSDYTISAWVYSDQIVSDPSTGHAIINKGNDQWLIGIYGDDENKYYDVMTRGNDSWNQAATSAEGKEVTAQSGVKVWRHVVGTWKGAGSPQDTARIYINGALANTTFFGDIANEGAGRNLTHDVHIGILGGSLDRAFIGRIDEVTVSGVVRDSNWIKLAYENQKPGNSLVDIGTYLTPEPPAAPTGVTAVATANVGGSVTVSWTAPANAGTSPITSYTVTSTPGGQSCFAIAPATTCAVTGLTGGTAYTFTVVATNVVGPSAASTPSNSVTPTTSLLPGSFVIRMDGTNPYSYRIPASLVSSTENLTMTIVNVHGKRVWSKSINPAQSKVSELTWDGRNLNGMRVSAGMYIVRIEAKMNGQTITSEQKGVNLKR